MKSIYVAFFLTLISASAFASEPTAVDLFADDAAQKGEAQLKEESDVTDTSKVQEKEGGIFSFFNFSFSDKKEEIDSNTQAADSNAQASVQETYLEKLTRTAEEGNIESQLALGYLYLYGENGEKVDYPKAFQYYTMAAAQEDIVALNNLGSLYFSGIGVKRDIDKSVALFEKASKLGNMESSVNLAFLFLSGKEVSKDSSRSMELFTRAANQGSPIAQFMLGYAYYQGFVLKQNHTKAFSLIKQAADAGFDDAQYVTAIMYINGHGTTKNYGHAVKYLNRAVTQGNVVAMVELGNILAKGTIYPKNILKAHILFNIASSLGAIGAAEKRDSLEKSIKMQELLQAHNEAEAFKEKPSKLTIYIRHTFGRNIRSYIDYSILGLKK